MPTLTVVAGPNGSGKSTLTRLGRETFQDDPVLDPDAISRSLVATGEGGGSAIDAGRAVLEKCEDSLASMQSLLVETTLSGNTYLRMMSRAKARDMRLCFCLWGPMTFRSILPGWSRGSETAGMMFRKRTS